MGQVKVIQLRGCYPRVRQLHMRLPPMMDLVLDQMQHKRGDVLLHWANASIGHALFGKYVVIYTPTKRREPQIRFHLQTRKIIHVQDLGTIKNASSLAADF